MKKTMSRILTLVLVLAMLVSVVPMALADEAAGTVTISGQPSGDVKVGEKVTLTATATANENYTTDGNITWVGAANGEFTASTVGPNKVTATATFNPKAGGDPVQVSAECTINVVAAEVAVESVTVNGPSAMVVGDTGSATATVLPEGANKEVSWTSSDSTVVSVGADGALEAKAAGPATITASS